MPYAFNTGFKDQTSPLLEFISDKKEGIFILPEGCIDVSVGDSGSAELQKVANMTSGVEKAIISGVCGGPEATVSLDSLAYLFYDGHYFRSRPGVVYPVVYKDRKISTEIRLCAKILQPIDFNFGLLAHPSSISLKDFLGTSYNSLEKLAKESNFMVASSSYTDCSILGPSKDEVVFGDFPGNRGETIKYCALEL